MASTLRFPTESDEKVPVVIVSHGGTLNDSGHNKMETWGRVLAEHGYLVIHVAHSTVPIEAVPQLCTAFSVPIEECELPTVNPPVALNPMDAKVVIDTLPTLDTWFENNTDIELDIERIGLLGWSGGSQVPTAVAGARRYLSPSVAITLGDERMGAGVVLSPQGPDFSGYHADESGTSMDTVTRPLLIATGDNDWKEVDNPTLLPEIRRQTYENLPTVDGHHRLLYSNLPIGTGGHGTDDLALMSTVRAHFDTHLKDSETGQAYLDSDDSLELAGRGKAEWDAR